MGPFIDVRRFSTGGLAEVAAREAWCERTSTLGRLFETTPSERFATSSTGFALGGVQIGYSTISAQRWQRTAAMARRDGVDWLTVNVRDRGAAQGDAGGADFSASGTSTILIDMAQPSDHISQASRTALIAIPRPLAEAVLGPVRALHGTVISPEASTLLRAHLRQLGRAADRIPVEQGGRLAGGLVDMLAVALAMEGRPVSPGADAADRALRHRAQMMIDARLTSATLTVAALGRALGVSRSTLYRLFADQGGVMAYIRDRRLDRAHALLGDAATVGPIAAVAEQLGFCDAAHFGRLFRARYGITPGEYRAMRRAQRSA